MDNPCQHRYQTGAPRERAQQERCSEDRAVGRGKQWFQTLSFCLHQKSSIWGRWAACDAGTCRRVLPDVPGLSRSASGACGRGNVRPQSTAGQSLTSIVGWRSFLATAMSDTSARRITWLPAWRDNSVFTSQLLLSKLLVLFCFWRQDGRQPSGPSVVKKPARSRSRLPSGTSNNRRLRSQTETLLA